ncbi:MAG: hypothetical protein R6X12_03940 [bacterium]
MPWYGFIHPVLAVGTLVYGVRAAQVSMSKVLDWDFPLRRQRTRSIIFFLLCIANLIVGFAANALMRGRGLDVRLTAHLPLAIVVIAFALVAAVVTYTRPPRPGTVSGLMKLHHWFLIIPSVLILSMGFTGLLKAFGL